MDTLSTITDMPIITQKQGAEKVRVKSDNCVLGLHILPPVVEFNDPKPNVTYEKVVKFVNVRERPVHLTFKTRMDHKDFKVICPSEEVALASGMSQTATVIYKCSKRDESFQTSFMVRVNEDPLQVPVVVQRSKPSMDVVRFIDFGTLVTDGRVSFGKICISNFGGRMGQFEIEYHGRYPIKVHQPFGKVPANTIAEVSVELLAVKAGTLRDHLEVSLDEKPPVKVYLLANLIQPTLQILSRLGGELMKRIQFGCVYYNSVSVQKAILYNNSPEPVEVVMVVDDRTAMEHEMRAKLQDTEGVPASVATMFAVQPAEGKLSAYGSLSISVIFQPKYSQSNKGWKTLNFNRLPPRRDFTIFIDVDPLGVTGAVLGSEKPTGAEVACTATALPVEVEVQPKLINFGLVQVGEKIDKEVECFNHSADLSLHFRVKSAPYVTISRIEGIIEPYQSMKLGFSFTAKALGNVKKTVYIQFFCVGPSLKKPDSSAMHIIRTMTIEVFAKTHDSARLGKFAISKFNPGITPLVCNEVGINVDDVTFKSSVAKPAIAMQQSNKSGNFIHDVPGEGITDISDDLIAFPNERPKSVRPYTRIRAARTIFTKVKRYRYVDNAYQYSARQASQKQAAKLAAVAAVRLHKEVASSEDNDGFAEEDIGLKPLGGLVPPDLDYRDTEMEHSKGQPESELSRSLRKAGFLKEAGDVKSKPVSEGLKPSPETTREKNDCKLKLSPQQQYKVIIGPAIMDFSKVCLKSCSTKNMYIINCLKSYIFITFEITSQEIKLISPLSLVLPPQCHTEIPLDFEPYFLGRFHRPLVYKINGHHERQVLVKAEVVEPTLVMEPEHVIIEPHICRNAGDGYHGVVTLTNPLNHPAKFEWRYAGESSNKDERPFSIYPRAGTIFEFCSMDCDVVYCLGRTGTEGRFSLNIREGDILILKCSVQLDMCKVVALEENVNLGPIPLNLPFHKPLILRNVSTCHAFFQIAHPHPVTGMNLTPVKGVIPAMGLVEILMTMCADSVFKVDGRIQANIRNGKTVEIKVTGQVEPPLVEFSLTSFHFKQVPCGSCKSIPFDITNRGKTKASIDLNVEGYVDFTLVLPHKSKEPVFKCTKEDSRHYSLDLKMGESVFAELCFHPIELVAYDFILPIEYNKLPSSLLACKTADVKNVGLKIKRSRTTKGELSSKTPSTPVEPCCSTCHVMGMATAPILEINPRKLEFTVQGRLPGLDHNKTRSFDIVNISDKRVTWIINLAQSEPPFCGEVFDVTLKQKNTLTGDLEPKESVTLQVDFHPYRTGHVYECVIPILVKGMSMPAGYLDIHGIWKVPKVDFIPSEVHAPLAPLNTEVHAEFFLVATEHSGFSIEDTELMDVEFLNEILEGPTVEVTFPEGRVVKVEEEGKSILPIVIHFKSLRPAYFVKQLILVTNEKIKYAVTLVGGAENCILSCHTMLQQWKKAVNITLPPLYQEEGSIPPEPMVVECSFLPPSRESRSTPSTFDIASSTDDYSDSPQKYEYSDGYSSSTYSSYETIMAVGSNGSPTCYTIDNIDLAAANVAERWFSVHGFPSGLYPTKIPHSLTRSLCQAQLHESRTMKQTPMGKMYLSIIDSIHHLTGRTVLANTKILLSPDVIERANQLYTQAENLIRFLKCQGGCVVGMKPHHLLGYEDYIHFVKGQDKLKKRGHIAVHFAVEDPDSFHAASSKAWTQYLLQMYKTLVLSRINLSNYSSLELPKPNGESKVISMSGMEPYSSNLYSIPERIILCWLNGLYNIYYTELAKITVGASPPTKRFVVNFDKDLMDGLVLAAVITAYLPFATKKYFKGLYGSTENLEQLYHNAIRVVSVLENIGIEYDVKPSDIAEPHPVGMLMLCVYLFEHLPLLLPRSTICFTGTLHNPVAKQIAMTNPSPRALSYKIMLVGPGADNYSTSHTHFNISPNGKFNLNIECKNKRLSADLAVLQLLAKRSGPTIGTSLVFILESQVSCLHPGEIITFEAPCYERRIKTLKIKNFYSEPGNFTISFKEFFVADLKDVDPYGKAPVEDMLRFFFCDTTSLDLEVKGSRDLEVQFLPLVMKNRQCFITFSNPRIGDFIYSIIGEVSLPSVMNYTGALSPETGQNIAEEYLHEDGAMHVNGFVGESHTIHLPILFENPALELALVDAAQMYLSNTEYAKRLETDTIRSPSVIQMLMNLLSEVQSSGFGLFSSNMPEEKFFYVEMDCDQFLIPSLLHLRSPESVKKMIRLKKRRPNSGNNKEPFGKQNILTIQITPNLHGYYQSRLILKSTYDVRVYMVKVRSNSTHSLAEITFTTPAHEATSQDIPIANVNKFNWNLDVYVDGRGFAGPPKCVVPAETSVNFPLSFWPMKEGLVSGRLKFVNQTDLMEYNFSLVGRGLQPKPFGAYVIHCQARETVHKSVEVPNITLRKLSFRIESDLSFVSGPLSISVPPLSKSAYRLEVYSLFSGHFQGTIAFRVVPTEPTVDSDGELVSEDEDDRDEWMGYMVWASLEVFTTPAPAEKALNMISNIMETTTMDVYIKNPMNIPMTFQIETLGEGVGGPRELIIPPHARDAYKISYSPIRIGTGEGRLIFSHEEVGEFWYSIRLQALAPLPTQLPDVKCQLGRSTTETLVLKNCSNEQVVVSATLTDSLNFALVLPELPFVVMPETDHIVQFHFTPSGIQRFRTKFVFSCTQLGDVIFHVFGIGLYPKDPTVIHINTPLSANNTHSVVFPNPTLFETVCKVNFKDPGGKIESNFVVPLDLYDNVRMAARSEISVPVTFRAKYMREYKAVLSVSLRRADKKLWPFLDLDKEQPIEIIWVYNIFGISEYIVDRRQRTLKCQCKKELRETISIMLHHCVPPTASQQVQPGAERFTFQLQVANRENLVRAFTTFILEKDFWDCKSNIAELTFRILFEPLMTMKAHVIFLVRSSAGGVWKLPMQFISAEGDPDECIVIRAVDMDPRENKHILSLCSPNEKPMFFQIAFMPKSDADFKVIPETGLLPPKDSEPLKITILFAPKNYVKTSKAKLLIQGQEYEWLYELTGIPPQYRGTTLGAGQPQSIGQSGLQPPSRLSSRMAMVESRSILGLKPTL